MQWQVTPAAKVVHIPGCSLEIRMLWRIDACNYWVLELSAPDPIGNYSSPSTPHVIVNEGYLLRTANTVDKTLRLTGDINATTSVELGYEPTGQVNTSSINDVNLKTSRNGDGKLCGLVAFKAPSASLPDFLTAKWKYIDSLPEILGSYDDAKWTGYNHTGITNDQ